ncbi:RNA-directed DNA polymerase, eukaryota [Tanacetum coccineum]
MPRKRQLWAYMTGIINHWHGEIVVMGDFKEVRFASEHHGSTFYASNAAEFNTFITNSYLIDVPLGLFPNLSGLILHRHISDHKLIILKKFHMDYDPTPFSLFHSLFLEQDFASVVEDSWNNDGVPASNVMILLKNKLKSLKQTLKTWIIQKRVSGSTIIEFSKNIYLRLNCVSTKERVKWAIEGDENSKFFHDIVNKKRRQQATKGILVDGEWIDNPDSVKSKFYNHFANKCSAPDWSCVPMKGIFPRRLGADSSHDLESDISIDEIKEVLDAKHLSDFRPISFTGCHYKIIGKILANRLSLMIDELIGHEQSTFIKGRQIFDEPLILNETVSWCKSWKEQALLFKVDFHKAFDSVRWDHLDDILGKFGFSSKWRGCTRSFLYSSKALVLANGSPTDEFLFRRAIHKAVSNLESKGVDLLGFCKKVIGNGKNSNFWYIKWLGDVCFKVKFNRLFNLDLQKDAYVAQKFQNPDFAVSFQRHPRGGIEESQFQELSLLLSLVVLSSSNDRWSWTLNGHGDFSVKSAREEIDKHLLITSSSSTRWSKLLPIKL